MKNSCLLIKLRMCWFDIWLKYVCFLDIFKNLFKFYVFCKEYVLSLVKVVWYDVLVKRRWNVVIRNGVMLEY